jgi:hypothetical protein
MAKKGPAKKKVSKRKDHPLIGKKEGYPFASVPGDYDFKTMKPLGRKDFITVAAFCDFKSQEAQQRARVWGERKEKSAQRGDPTAKATARETAKIKKLMEKLEVSKKKLQGLGLTDEQIEAAMEMG